MSNKPLASYVYVAYIAAANDDVIREVAGLATDAFSTSCNLQTKKIARELIQIFATSEKVIENTNVFESRVNGLRYTEILLSYVSPRPMHIYSMMISYQFVEKIYLISANTFRRELAQKVYGITSLDVGCFMQDTHSTRFVLCSEKPIEDKDLVVLENIEETSNHVTSIHVHKSYY